MKRGFTILECIIALGITAVMLVMAIPPFMRYTYNFREDIVQNQNHFYAAEALMFIEYELQDSRNTIITNNLIELQYDNNSVKKYIALNSEKYIVITHKVNGVSQTSNRILGKVKEFKVQNKKNTAYVAITLNNGETFERCLRINTIE
jgi:prepilin-type N-terminal cleavage/methylation domain-containing protein